MAEKEKILERYRVADDVQFVIDIAAGRIEDLYDNFDKRAPYLVKELDKQKPAETWVSVETIIL